MKKVIALLFALLIVAGGLYLQRERVLILIGSYLVSEDPVSKADAIAVLSGDVPYRILEGIDLYRRGLAPRILLTPFNARRYLEMMKTLGVNYQTNAEINRRIAVHRGVPAKAIEVLPPAQSTRNEAEVILSYLRARKLRSVIVVTSRYHSTRTRVIFRSQRGDARLKVAVRPSRYDKFDPRAWWRSRSQSKKVFYEYLKLANHYTFGF
ncbi:MAG: YdcF family protein [Nitrospinota bacterium]